MMTATHVTAHDSYQSYDNSMLLRRTPTSQAWPELLWSVCQWSMFMTQGWGQSCTELQLQTANMCIKQSGCVATVTAGRPPKLSRAQVKRFTSLVASSISRPRPLEVREVLRKHRSPEENGALVQDQLLNKCARWQLEGLSSIIGCKAVDSAQMRLHSCSKNEVH